MPILKKISFYSLTIVFVLVMIQLSFLMIEYIGVGSQQHKAESRGLSHLSHHFDSSMSTKRPHPYWGYVREKPSSPYDLSENNLNYLEQASDESKLSVGIFGGSVAKDFYDYIFSNSRFEIRLRNIFKIPKSTRIEYVNFAVGGYKQPQQLNISMIFSHLIDIAISIEGSNELSYVIPPDLPNYYPYVGVSRIFFSHDTSSLMVYMSALWARQILDRIDQFNSIYKNQLALTRVPLRVFSKFLINQIVSIEAHFVKQRVHLYQSQKEHSPNPFTPVSLWVKSLSYQQEIFRLESIPHFAFFQPLFYQEGSKPLSKIEKSYAPYLANDFEKAFVLNSLGYILSAMKARGVQLVDLRNIFRDIRETVYTDSCCHMNEKGMEILAQSILEEIKKRSPFSIKTEKKKD